MRKRAQSLSAGVFPHAQKCRASGDRGLEGASNQNLPTIHFIAQQTNRHPQNEITSATPVASKLRWFHPFQSASHRQAAGDPAFDRAEDECRQCRDRRGKKKGEDRWRPKREARFQQPDFSRLGARINALGKGWTERANAGRLQRPRDEIHR
jgi:hypothetical protein